MQQLIVAFRNSAHAPHRLICDSDELIVEFEKPATFFLIVNSLDEGLLSNPQSGFVAIASYSNSCCVASTVVDYFDKKINVSFWP
jgi:hypothetical protein